MDITFELIDIVNIITVFLLLLLSFFLFSYKKGKIFINRILAIFLIAKAIGIIDVLLSRLQIPAYGAYPQIFYTANLFSFLWGPSLYFYTRSLSYHNFSFKKKHIIHLIPFALYLIYMIFYFHIFSRGLLIPVREFGHLEVIIVTSIINLFILGYLIASLHTLGTYRLKIKNCYSSIENINLSWLTFILLGFIAVWMIEFSNNCIWLKTCFRISYLSYASVILMFIFTTIIVYNGLKHAEIFSGIEEKTKYEKSLLRESDAELYKRKLLSYMNQEKPYLVATLSLNELADNLAILPRYLSQILNQHFRQNFFDFINSYRIEEAKNILQNPSNNELTILHIVFQAGFNSKSAFNYAFKKHTGMTPTEFKKSDQA